MTKEVLGAEIIYSLQSKYGSLMAKTDYEVEDGIKVNLSVPFSAMYLFDADEKRIPLGSNEQEMIQKAFKA
jgi:sn-glycerol 3-phosphate transport system ATP-binding protein